jgi:hypothetical protein
MALCLVMSVCLGSALAQDAIAPIAPSPQVVHAWQVPPPHGSAQAYFANLKDNDKIETPFVLRFGLSGGLGPGPDRRPHRWKIRPPPSADQP